MMGYLLIKAAFADKLISAHVDRFRAITPVVRYLKRLEPNTALGGANTVRWRVDGLHVQCSVAKVGGSVITAALRRTDLKPWMLIRTIPMDLPGQTLPLKKLQAATAAWRRQIYPEVTEWKTGKHVLGDSGDNGHRRWFVEQALPDPWREGLPQEVRVKIDVVKGEMETIAFGWPDEKEYFKRPRNPSFNLPPLERDLTKINP